MRTIFQLICSLICMISMILAPSHAFGQNKPAKNDKKMSDFRSQMPKPGPAPKIQIGDYTTYTLANGLQVIVVENHKIPRIAVQLYIDNEPILEKDTKGYVDITGSLLSKGTKTRTKAEIDEAVEFTGAEFSTSSRGFTGSSLTKHIDKLLEIASDVLLNPSFPKAEFDKLKTQTISSLQQAKEEPNTIAANVASVLNFGKDFPYGEIETEKTIGKLTLDQCINYYNSYFKPNRAYFIIVGDIKPEAAKALAEKYFSSWTKGEIAPVNYIKPKQPEGTKLDFVNRDGAVQSLIYITYPLDLKPGSADVIKTSVMNNILGGGAFAARLFQNLREKHAYTYGAYASLSNDRLMAKFSATANVRNAVSDSAVTQFLLEMNRIRNEKVTDLELSTIKNMLAGDFARSLENPQTVASFALNTIRYKLPKDYYATYLEKLAAVNVDDVQEVAKKYILPENAHIIVVGNKEEVAPKLAKFSSDKVVHYYTTSGEKIEQSTQSLNDVKPEDVLNMYIKAIGGEEKINAIKDLHMTMETNMGGMALQAERFQKMPDKFAERMTSSGMVLQEQIYNAGKGQVGQMGQNQPMDAETLNETQNSVDICPQLVYIKKAYAAKILGTDDVEGKQAYKMEITMPGGTKKVEFYDITSHLKVREVSTQGAGEQTATVTSDYSDYRAVEGVLFPYMIKVSGGGLPMALEMKVVNLDINKGIDDSTFKVN